MMRPMIRADRQDVAIKCAVAAVGVLVIGAMLSGWHYESAVVAMFGVIGWLVRRKLTAHRGYVMAAVALGGLVVTVGVNRLVTHLLVVENRSGTVISHLFVSGWLTEANQMTFHAQNFSDGECHSVSFKSLLFDGELQVQVKFPDGSYFEGNTWGLEETYRRKSHVFIREGGVIEILRP